MVSVTALNSSSKSLWKENDGALHLPNTLGLGIKCFKEHRAFWKKDILCAGQNCRRGCRIITALRHNMLQNLTHVKNSSSDLSNRSVALLKQLMAVIYFSVLVAGYSWRRPGFNPTEKNGTGEEYFAAHFGLPLPNIDLTVINIHPTSRGVTYNTPSEATAGRPTQWIKRTFHGSSEPAYVNLHSD